MTIPDNFYKRCEENNREALKFVEKSEDKGFSHGEYGFLALDIDANSNMDTYYKLMAESNLAYALFMQNKISEAKQITENYIQSLAKIIKEEKKSQTFSNKTMMAVIAYRRFFIDSYALSKDDDYKSWVIEKENEITTMLKTEYSGQEEAYDNFYHNQSYEELCENYKVSW